MSYINSIHNNNAYNALSSFGNTFICNTEKNTANKTVTFSNGFNASTDFDTTCNLAFKVVFVNGYENTSDVALTLNSVPVVVNKYGTLTPISNNAMDNGSGGTIYKCLQENTVLEMYYTNNYDGLNHPAFVVVGNPVVLSSASYTIYADGHNINNIGNIEGFYKKTNPYGYLYLDGSTFDTTLYHALYVYLGTNVLPDYREFVLVGAEQNTTSATIAEHDVFTQGEEKDDQLQNYIDGGDLPSYIGGESSVISLANGNYNYYVGNQRRTLVVTRRGNTTRTKEKAVFWYIKAY
jgi:hypothetical protein